MSLNGDFEREWKNMRLRTPRDFGALIRERRRKTGLRQEQLARKAGVGRQWLVEVEKGKAGAPLGLVLRTLDALGITLTANENGARAERPAHRGKPVDIDQLLDELRTPKKRKS
jgi:HTH-type transcriptional regulator / antitoxin HipB